MKNLASYPKIASLGLKIYEDPYPHVLAVELRRVLTREQLDKYQKLRPYGTILKLDSGEIGLYPWDVESILGEINQDSYRNYK